MGWTKKLVNAKQKEVKLLLDELLEEKGIAAKKKCCFQAIKRYSADIDPVNQLYCFFYIIALLVQHQKIGCLNPKEVMDLIDHAKAILLLMKIDNSAHPLAYLMGDVYALSSQISRKSGNHWESSWEQHNANRFHLYEKARRVDGKKMALGIRSMRLGQLRVARLRFQEVLERTQDDKLKVQAGLNLLRLLRWQNEFESWNRVRGDLACQNLSESEQKELSWEIICRNVMEDTQLRPCINAISIKGSHFSPVYVCEGFLWCYAHADSEWRKNLTRMESHRKNTALKLRHMHFHLKACLALEQAYDKSVAFERRLSDIGTMIASRQNLPSMEMEMLFSIAVVRWLTANGIRDLAQLVLEDYRILSLIATGGKSEDNLKTAADLMDKSWFF
jgi:hypothetical protein